ncbi:core-binding factor subunit beta-like isoform X4 [Porites lutea]|uniref:core-binding factor subunit beta-like isoform X4 n=1 Tax=Porites lutea TaxID=51062 RepID=UPI003CC50A65
MPRVVAEQRHKFENDDLFRKMSRETEIKYTGYRDRSHEERIVRFQTEARDGQATVVFIKSRFIMNGVCVVWKGWLDLQRLDGAGYLEFDEDKAKSEDKVMRETLEQAKRRVAEFEERQRQWREEQQRKESEASSHHRINYSIGDVTNTKKQPLNGIKCKLI